MGPRGGFTKKSHGSKTYYILAHYQVPARKELSVWLSYGFKAESEGQRL